MGAPRQRLVTPEMLMSGAAYLNNNDQSLLKGK